MRKSWTQFQAGQRPRRDLGRFDQEQVQLGFELLSNVILENGTIRKRKGLVNSGTKDDGTAITSHDARPFSNGTGPLAWQGNALYFLLGLNNQGQSPVRRDLSLAHPIGSMWWSAGKVASFLGTDGVRRTVFQDDDGTMSYSDTEFGLIVEGAGRRFFFSSPQEYAGFAALSFDGVVAVCSVGLSTYLSPGKQLEWAAPGVHVSINYNPTTTWMALCPDALCPDIEAPATHSVVWWWRNGRVYSMAYPGLGIQIHASSASDSQAGHTYAVIGLDQEQIEVRGSRSAKKKTVALSGPLVTGNTLTVVIDSVPVVARAFATDSPTTMAAAVADINASAAMLALGVQAVLTTPLIITLAGPVEVVTAAITGGASQAKVTGIKDYLRDFEYTDGSGMTLIDTDPIILTLRGLGYIRWAAWGGGLFLGTSKGVYEIVSGLGPGYSPLAGGFYPQEIANIPAFSVAHAKTAAFNQGVAITRSSVVFVSDVDQVTIMNRYTKSINSLRLDLNENMAIDALAYFGGSKVAILVANVAKRAAWNTVTGYDASDNFILILDENDGAFTEFPIPAISIYGLDGIGLLTKQVDASGAVQVGMVPWRGSRKYQASPVPDDTEFTDRTLAGEAPVAASLVTMPIHLSRDLGDPKKISSVALRVLDTKHLEFGQKGCRLRAWNSYEDGGADEPFTGDIVRSVDSSRRPLVQIQVDEATSGGLEILALQVDIESNTVQGGVA